MAKNKLSGLLNQSYQKGYNQGLADGQYIMMHIIQVALHETFGFGNSNREKWKELDSAIDKKVDYITARINEGEAEMGFEKLVEGMRIARGDEIGDKVEQLYKEVLYNFNKEQQMKKYLMKCGHVSNAMTRDKRPVCAICDCDKILHEVEGNEGLEGRMSICSGHNSKYGQAVPVPSKWTLPFFEYRPDCEYDLYYCGCYGWG